MPDLIYNSSVISTAMHNFNIAMGYAEGNSDTPDEEIMSPDIFLQVPSADTLISENNPVGDWQDVNLEYTDATHAVLTGYSYNSSVLLKLINPAKEDLPEGYNITATTENGDEEGSYETFAIFGKNATQYDVDNNFIVIPIISQNDYGISINFVEISIIINNEVKRIIIDVSDCEYHSNDI